jgi:hypothetical protein
MTARRRRMREDPQLRGLAPRTQQCSLEAVKHLAQHYRRAPEHIREEEIRQYFRSLRNDRPVAARTFRSHLSGLRFCSEITLQRPWPVCTRIRPRHRPQLPVVLRLQAGRALLTFVVTPHASMCLQVMDACDLRLRALCRSRPSTPNACWSGSARAQGAETASCPWPSDPLNGCARTGSAHAPAADSPAEDLYTRGTPERHCQSGF